MVFESILFATVKFVNVPRVVIFGWLLVAIVALIVAASILLDTRRLLCAFNKPATVKAVCVPNVTILGWLLVVIDELIVLESILLATVRLVSVPSVVMFG